MGWNDRNPDLHDAMVKDGIIDGPLYDDPAPYAGPLPARPESCECGATGDTIRDPLHHGSCHDCGSDVCDRCAEIEADDTGALYYCTQCTSDAPQ